MTKMKEGDEDLARVRQLAQEIGIGWDDFLKEKVLELQERRRAAAIPNVTWYRDHPHDLDSFLDLMHFPQTDEVRETFKEYLKGFLKGGHRTTLDKAAEEELLKRQNQRCRSCGKRLTRDPRDYEVDHIVPFSAQDRDRLENFQLLCSKCNIGKSDASNYAALAAWRVSNSDIRSEGRRCSRWSSVRYATLARDSFVCGRCSATSKTSRLYVKMHIPWSSGGQLILDNTEVRCESCTDKEGDDEPES